MSLVHRSNRHIAKAVPLAAHATWPARFLQNALLLLFLLVPAAAGWAVLTGRAAAFYPTGPSSGYGPFLAIFVIGLAVGAAIALVRRMPR